jgi:hypothetical protein
VCSGGARLGPKTENPDGVSSWFPTVSPRKLWDITSYQINTTSFHVLINSLFTPIQSFDAIYLELMTKSLNKLQINTMKWLRLLRNMKQFS